MVRRREEGYLARIVKNSLFALALVIVLFAVSVVPVTATDGDVNVNPDAIHNDPGFSSPFGIAVAPDGSLVVADYGLGVIVRVNPITGNRSIVSDASTGSGAGILLPYSIAVEADGSIVVADIGLEAILRVNPINGDRTILSDVSTGILEQLPALPPASYRQPTQTGSPPQEMLPDLSLQQLEEARNLYPPFITQGLLTGSIPAPDGFDDCVSVSLGQERLKALRSGAAIPTGMENDITAACLLELGTSPQSLGTQFPAPPGGPDDSLPGLQAAVEVSEVDSNYRVAQGNLSGWFTSGQEADIMLSGFDFDNSGGPLSFNHPKGIASDGVRLLLVDGNNNRVLIWNNLPVGNTSPDVVLGQPDFTSNSPGTGRHQMNWPVGVSTDGTRVVVADTYNDRILIWTQFPTSNATPADIVLDGWVDSIPFGQPSKTCFGWPWGVWTDGEKLVISSTQGSYVLIWNTFPFQDNQPADVYLGGGGDMGTPRTITSNGKCLIVGDHNAKNTGQSIGNFFWSTFPVKDDEPYDFFSPDPLDFRGAWMTGDFTPDGRLLMLGSTLHIWDTFPTSATDLPTVSISDFKFTGGDGASLAIAGEKIYVSMYNGNRVVVYNSIPTKPSEKPDFALGSPDIYTNTLDTRYSITNGVPATDGKSLFVSSDFDCKLYVWKQLPDQSGVYPDVVYTLPEPPWDNVLWNDTLVLAGRDTVFIWRELPLDGQLPDAILRGGIGGILFQDLKGVAMDDRYFYLSDTDANKVYVWNGIPDVDTPPQFSISVDGPWRLSSDGDYLAVTSIFNHAIYLYKVADLSANAQAFSVGGRGTFNLPQNAIVAQGRLFVGDTGFNRVQIWRDLTEAINGRNPDVILGKGGPDSSPLALRDALFWPAGLAFDGSYLWVGEFKFSFRLLRFSVR